MFGVTKNFDLLTRFHLLYNVIKTSGIISLIFESGCIPSRFDGYNVAISEANSSDENELKESSNELLLNMYTENNAKWTFFHTNKLRENLQMSLL